MVTADSSPEEQGQVGSKVASRVWKAGQREAGMHMEAEEEDGGGYHTLRPVTRKPWKEGRGVQVRAELTTPCHLPEPSFAPGGDGWHSLA